MASLRLHSPSLLPNPGQTRDDLIPLVKKWQTISLAVPLTQFREDVDAIICHSYPTHHKDVLDDLLVTFLLFHPEHISSILSPLVKKLSDQTLPYHRKAPPFHSFLSLFYGKLTPSILVLHRRIIQFLLLEPLKDPEFVDLPSPVRSWGSDLLLGGSPSLREFFISNLLSTSFQTFDSQRDKDTSKGNLRSKSIYLLNTIAQEERNQKKSCRLASAAVGPLLRICASLPMGEDEGSCLWSLKQFKPIWKLAFSSKSVDMSASQETRQTISYLLKGDKIPSQLSFAPVTSSSYVISELISLLSSTIKTLNWFESYFLEPLLEAVGKGAPNAFGIFRKLLNDSQLCLLLFGAVPSSSRFFSLLGIRKGNEDENIHRPMEGGKEASDRVLKAWKEGWDLTRAENIPWSLLKNIVEDFSSFHSEGQEVILEILSQYLLRLSANPSETKVRIEDLFRFGFFQSGVDFIVVVERIIQLCLRSSNASLALTGTNTLRSLVKLLPQYESAFLLPSEAFHAAFKSLQLIRLLLEREHKEYFVRLLSESDCSTSLFSLLRSKEPDLRQHVCLILSTVEELSKNIDGVTLNWTSISLNHLVQLLLQQSFPNVLKAASDCLERLTSRKDLAPMLLEKLWESLIRHEIHSGDEAERTVRLISDIVSAYPECSQFLSLRFQQAVFSWSSSTLSYGGSYPNPNILRLARELLNRSGNILDKESVELCLGGIGQNPPDVQLLQFQILVVCAFSANDIIVGEHLSKVIAGTSASFQPVQQLCSAILSKWNETHEKPTPIFGE